MPLCGAGCKFARREAAKARVRSSHIIVETPTFDDAACPGQAPEQVFVETFVAEAGEASKKSASAPAVVEAPAPKKQKTAPRKRTKRLAIAPVTVEAPATALAA
jgi:hypothetical protein